eukprot:TRINITY_DN28407_c0_g1_i1.p1 TRINITY_DN28407_c0_g1~~TRINITY_DN28407_c0_g1_i1.p1  ORF type:complete len:1011 (-),score=229.99 TRINITY_DN28407_c0_g1_i1:168-3200(-)
MEDALASSLSSSSSLAAESGHASARTHSRSGRAPLGERGTAFSGSALSTGGSGCGKENEVFVPNSPKDTELPSSSGSLSLSASWPGSAAALSQPMSLGDRLRADAAAVSAAASTAELTSRTYCSSECTSTAGDAAPPQLELAALRRRFTLMSGALRRSNASQAELQSLLERALDECDQLRERNAALQDALEEARVASDDARTSEAEARRRCDELRAAETEARRRRDELQLSEGEARAKIAQLEAAEAELRRSRDSYHHKWCLLDQEREAMQRASQQAQATEKAARAGETTALEEAASWRRWLASFLDVLLRRGTLGLRSAGDGDVSTSQCLQAQQPKIHGLLAGIAEGADRAGPQGELLARLPPLFDHVSELIADGKLVVRWGGELEEERRRMASTIGESTERVAQLERQLQQKELSVAGLEHERRALQGELRHLQNTIQELRGSIRVFCRVRPARRGASGPLAAAGIGCRVEGTQKLALRKPPGDRRHEFLFDRVFPPDARQPAIYEEVEPLLPGVLDGLHLCIFAYGQTGAGKTYTLSGATSRQALTASASAPELLLEAAAGLASSTDAASAAGAGAGEALGLSSEAGIQDLAIAELLRQAGARSAESSDGSVSYEMWLSALEIYNESLQDLLVETSGSSAASQSLDIRQSRDGALQGGGGVPETEVASTDGPNGLPSPFGSLNVPGLRMLRIRGQVDVDSALRLVASNRHVAATAMNGRSSRSHCVLSLSLIRRKAAGACSARGFDIDTASSASASSSSISGSGVLHIVDLAGSERTKVSQAEGQQMKEANAINKSLAALADVLYSLGEESQHVPYRNSKLTYLLQEALGSPGCKTLLFAQVSPEPVDVQETYSTLTFASRVATNVQKGRLRPGALHAPSASATSAAAGARPLQQQHRTGTPPRRMSTGGSTPPRGSPNVPRESPGKTGTAKRCSPVKSHDVSPCRKASGDSSGHADATVLMSSPVPLPRNGGGTAPGASASAFAPPSRGQVPLLPCGSRSAGSIGR